MPIYEYRCSSCYSVFQALRPMFSAREGMHCPSCGSLACRLMPTSFAAFRIRDGYPRGLPDKGRSHGPIGPYTTGAAPAERAAAIKDLMLDGQEGR